MLPIRCRILTTSFMKQGSGSVNLAEFQNANHATLVRASQRHGVAVERSASRHIAVNKSELIFSTSPIIRISFKQSID